MTLLSYLFNLPYYVVCFFYYIARPPSISWVTKWTILYWHYFFEEMPSFTQSYSRWVFISKAKQIKQKAHQVHDWDYFKAEKSTTYETKPVNLTNFN